MKLTHSWSFRASENRWPACFWPNVMVSWASASKVRWLRSATSTSIGVCISRNLWLRLDMSVGRTRHSGFTLVSILSQVFYWLSRLNSGGEVHLCHDDSFRAGDCCTVGWKLIHSLIGILIIWWFVVLAFWRFGVCVIFESWFLADFTCFPAVFGHESLSGSVARLLADLEKLASLGQLIYVKHEQSSGW